MCLWLSLLALHLRRRRLRHSYVILEFILQQVHLPVIDLHPISPAFIISVGKFVHSISPDIADLGFQFLQLILPLRHLCLHFAHRDTGGGKFRAFFFQPGSSATCFFLGLGGLRFGLLDVLLGLGNVLFLRRRQWAFFAVPVLAMLLLAVPWGAGVFSRLPPFFPELSSEFFLARVAKSAP